MKQSTHIIVSFRDYNPPIDVQPVVTRLLSSIPEGYLAGLSTVIITNASGLPRKRRRFKSREGKRKVPIKSCLGLYYEEWEGTPAYIDLFVDNILSEYPLIIWRIPPFRDKFLAEILYHELGHHIHKTRAPEFRGQELVADEWEHHFSRIFLRRRYWYLLPLIPIVWFTSKLSDFLRNSIRK